MSRRYSFWASPIEHRSIRVLDDVYRGWFTPTGHVVFWAMIIFGLLQRGVSEMLLLGLAMCAACLVSAFVLGFPFRPRVVMQRHLPAAPTAGEVMRYRVTVTNKGRWTARQVIVQERWLPANLRPSGEPPTLERLAPGESVTVTLALECKARGAYSLKRLQAASVFPGNLWKWARRQKDVQTVLVHPPIVHLNRLEIPLGRHYQPGGMALASRVGDSSEFLGTRDWRRGDRLRDLHWPSFARTGRPIVKEFQEEYFVRVAMILDTEVRNSREEALFEKALGFSAGVVTTLARQEAIIDLLAVGSELHRFQAGRALAQVVNVLDVMACLEIDWEFDAATLEAALLPELSRLSAVFALLTRWDARRAALIESIRARGVAVRVLLLKQPKTPPGLQPEELLVLPS